MSSPKNAFLEIFCVYVTTLKHILVIPSHTASLKLNDPLLMSYSSSSANDSFQVVGTVWLLRYELNYYMLKPLQNQFSLFNNKLAFITVS